MTRQPANSNAIATAAAAAGGTQPGAAAAGRGRLPPGTRLGHYRLQRVVGEGGFGTVYLARQTTPVIRDVAVKVLKPGLGPAALTARFAFEGQALARMNHPHIAAVFDAGTSAEGRPYFVMEWVDGEPITSYCDRRAIGLRGRLTLFASICRAVEHAHQKGIIHRDLKPSNVLVEEVGGEPVAKVIDFGVAKAAAGGTGELPALTLAGQVVGTEEYMSPEQARLGPADIDTRSDIYSLGVLLYELLTGTTPFTREQLASAASYVETLKLIREVEPPRPSTRISSIGSASDDIARRRGATRVNTLSKRVRGDLDAIVMKALEKERERRYPSAAALAADIDHHLADEPVTAGPPTRRYRTFKFLQRHRRGAAVAAAATLALVAASVYSTAMYRRAEGLRALEAERAGELRKERAGAERARRDAEDLAAFMVDELRAGLNALGRPGLIGGAVAEAGDYFKPGDPRAGTVLLAEATAAHQRADTPRAAAASARAYERLGRAGGHAGGAALEALLLLGRVREEDGDADGAGSAFRGLLRRGAGGYFAGGAHNGLARLALAQGDTPAAGEHLEAAAAALASAPVDGLAPLRAEAAAETHRLRAHLLSGSGDTGGAHVELTAARDRLAAVLATDPSRATARHLRARLDRAWAAVESARTDRAPDDDAAEARLRAAAETLGELTAADPEHRLWAADLRRAQIELGHCQARQGRHAAAAAAFAAALDTARALETSATTPARSQRHRLQRAEALGARADLRRRQRLLAPARAACKEALQILTAEPGADSPPGWDERRVDLLALAAEIELLDGDPARAADLYRAALAEADFGDLADTLTQNRLRTGLGAALRQAGSPPEAAAELRAAADALIEESAPAARRLRARALTELAGLVDARGAGVTPGDARAYLEDALAALRGLPRGGETDLLAAAARARLGQIADGDTGAGSTARAGSAESADRTGAPDPGSQAAAELTLKRAAALIEKGRSREAYPLLRTAVTDLENLFRAGARKEGGDGQTPAPPGLRRALASAHADLGAVLARQRPDAALPHAHRAVEIRSTLVDAGTESSDGALEELAADTNSLALVIRNLGRPGEAEHLFRHAHGLLAPLIEAGGGPAQAPARLLETASVSLHFAGDSLYAQRRLQEAEEALRAAVVLRRELARRTDREGRLKTRWQGYLATTFNLLGPVLRDRGEPGEARAALTAALEIREDLAAHDPENPLYQDYLANALNNLGRLLAAAGEHAEAGEVLQRALGVRERLVERFPRDPNRRYDLSTSINNLGEWHFGQGRLTPAAARFEEAAAHRHELVDAFPRSTAWREGLARALENAGQCHLQRDLPDLAEPPLRDAHAHWLHLAEARPQNLGTRAHLGRSHRILALLHQARGDANATRREAGEAVRILSAVVAQRPDKTWRSWLEKARALEAAP